MTYKQMAILSWILGLLIGAGIVFVVFIQIGAIL